MTTTRLLYDHYTAIVWPLHGYCMTTTRLLYDHYTAMYDHYTARKPKSSLRRSSRSPSPGPGELSSRVSFAPVVEEFVLAPLIPIEPSLEPSRNSELALPSTDQTVTVSWSHGQHRIMVMALAMSFSPPLLLPNFFIFDAELGFQKHLVITKLKGATGAGSSQVLSVARFWLYLET